MRETSKCHRRRLEQGDFERYMRGKGIDIGSGDDPVAPPNGLVRPWDKIDGDAMAMTGIDDASFDFIYSSHCLEHLTDVAFALQQWARILKPSGWFYLVVPDYGLYEKWTWPSQFNHDHKATFSLDLTRQRVGRLNHFNIRIDLVSLLQSFNLRTDIMRLEDEGFDYNQGIGDQTLNASLAQICVIAQKHSER